MDPAVIKISAMSVVCQLFGIWHTSNECQLKLDHRKKKTKQGKKSKRKNPYLTRLLTKKLLAAKKAVKTGSKLVKSGKSIELVIMKQIVSFVLKQVVVGLIIKRRLPKTKTIKSFFVKLGKSLGWAVLTLPVIRLVNNKEMFVPVAFSFLVLTTRMKDLVNFVAIKARMHKCTEKLLRFI